MPKFVNLGLVELSLTPEQLKKVRDNDSVAYVEEVQMYHAYATPALSWGIDRINQASLPLDNNGSFKSGAASSTVDVYVIGKSLYLLFEFFL